MADPTGYLKIRRKEAGNGPIHEMEIELDYGKNIKVGKNQLTNRQNVLFHRGIGCTFLEKICDSFI